MLTALETGFLDEDALDEEEAREEDASLETAAGSGVGSGAAEDAGGAGSTCWVEDGAGAGVEDASELLEAAEGVEDGGS